VTGVQTCALPIFPRSAARTNSLGLQIVGLLVDQLEGSLEIDGRNGARFAFTFHEVREKSIPQPAH